MAALNPGELGFGACPEAGDFLADLGGDAVLAFGEVGLQGSLPVVEPGSELVFKLLHGWLGRLGRAQGGDLVDLAGEALDFLPLLLAADLGILAGGGGQALQCFLESLEPGLVVAQAFFPWGGGFAGQKTSFQTGHPGFELFQMPADDDFPNAFDRNGWIDGWG